MTKARSVAADGRGRQASGAGRPLPARQSRALAALLTSRSTADAARAADVPERTVRRWLAEDETFRAELREARAEARAGLAGAIRDRALEAVDVLASVMGDAAAPAASRVTAARALLELAVHNEAEELAERVERLEALLQEDG